MRKSQIQYQIFVYIASAVLVVLIMVFSVKGLISIKQKQRHAIVIDFEQKLKSIVELLSGDYGATQEVEFRVPDDVDTVCLVDLNKRDALLKGVLAEAYPDIKKSLEDLVLKNAFLLAKSKVTDAFYAGNLCLSSPYYKCIDTPQHVLRMLVKGKKDCIDIIKPIRTIKLNNFKNDSKYKDSPIFLVNEKEANVRQILQLLPIAMWNDRQQGIVSYPYYVYYENLGKGSIDDYTNLLKKHKSAGTGKQLIFWTSEPLPYNLGGTDAIAEKFGNYASYWNTMIDVVVLNTSNTDGALISSLFASYLIAPVVFTDKANYNTAAIKSFIDGKRVYIIDAEKLDPKVRNYIEHNAKEFIEDYDSEVLRVDSDLNPYKALISAILPSTSFS